MNPHRAPSKPSSPPSPDFFRDKTALITGAASGIGRATAKSFARHGAKLALIDCDAAPGEALASELRDQGVAARFFQADVSESSQVERAFQEIARVFPRLDFAFNNAGTEGTPAPCAEITTEQWQRTLRVNLDGIFWCLREELKVFLRQGGGAIVNCSSIAGLRGFLGMSAYVASKHAVLGLTKSAALDYANRNVRVNAVCPGVIQTPMIDRFTHGSTEALTDLAAREPMGRFGHPEEVAASVLWLCSPEASFVTGTELVVDGGWCAK